MLSKIDIDVLKGEYERTIAKKDAIISENYCRTDVLFMYIDDFRCISSILLQSKFCIYMDLFP